MTYDFEMINNFVRTYNYNLKRKRHNSIDRIFLEYLMHGTVLGNEFHANKDRIKFYIDNKPVATIYFYNDSYGTLVLFESDAMKDSFRISRDIGSCRLAKNHFYADIDITKLYKEMN